MSDSILLAEADGVATLVLNRPEKLNALNLAMTVELADLLGALEADDDTRAVVLTGAGRGFCSGADVGDLAAPDDEPVRHVADGGDRVDVVFHMSGTGFEPELRALGMLGRIVVFGNAAREQNEVATNYLLRTSKSVLGFWLAPLIARRRDLVAKVIAELVGAVADGELKVVIGGVYPLSEVARAHTEMQERRTSGKLLLDPAA